MMLIGRRRAFQVRINMVVFAVRKRATQPLATDFEVTGKPFDGVATEIYTAVLSQIGKAK